MQDRVDEWLTQYEAGHIDRRQFLGGIAALAAQATPGRTAAPVSGIVRASGIHHVEIKTLDVPRARDFYAKLLGGRVETRDEFRVVIPFGGPAGGYLTIGTAPIPKVDHFSLKVPGMHPRDPKPTLDAVLKAGYKARQVDHSVYVMDPNGYEIEFQAPGTTV